MFANAQQGGIDLGFPDVCLTPPGPTPVLYFNIALGAMGIPRAYKVLFEYAVAHNLLTITPLSQGDDPGIAGGVASGLVKGPARPVTGAFSCLICGAAATRLTGIGVQNSTNCPGARLAPSQRKVLVLAA
jgi:hypothetical protein